MPAIGAKSVLNGKPVRWSGENYGWQSFGSHDKLKREGKFKLGAQLLDRVGSAIQKSPVTQTLLQAQQKFREATKFVEPVERLVNKAVKADDKLPSSRVAQGGAVLAGRAANAANVDPRLALIPGMLLGAVHTSGPRAGTVKQSGALRAQYPKKIDSLEDALEQFYKRTNESGGKLSKAYPPDQRTLLDLGDGNEAFAFDGGNFNFGNRSGIRVKTRPIPVVGKNPTKPAPIPSVSTKVQAPKPEPLPINQSDDLRRYHPQPTPKGRTITREQKVALINPDPVDLKAKSKQFYSQAPVTGRSGVTYSAAPGSKLDRAYTVPASDKQVKITNPDGSSQVHKIEGAKTIQERVRKIPGNEDVVVDSMQAHHRNVLKESTDFMQYFDDPSIVSKAYAEFGIYPGDDVMQRIDLPVRLHQTDPSLRYRGYNQYAAHERLQARPGTPEHKAGTPIQAERGMSRWSHLSDLPNDEARSKFIKQHIDDLRKSEQIALEAYFQQFLLQPNREQFGVDPYIGNFAQQVLAPHDSVGDKLRQAYIDMRKRQANAQ